MTLDIRDKWEMEVASDPLQRQESYLLEIKHQLDSVEAQISELQKKRAMHLRDLEYVTAAILNKLPRCVLAKAVEMNQAELKPVR